MEVSQAKALQRREGIAARRALSPEARQAYDAAICAALLGSGVYRAAHTILLYSAVGGEVSLAAFARAADEAGKRLCYPRCLPGRRMEALHPPSAGGWTAGAYGIPVPDPACSPVVPPEEVELVLVPCTRFDGGCRRVGMGGGYYDRYLPRCTAAVTVAVAYGRQRAERVAADGLDVPLDSVLTEEGWLWRGNGRPQFCPVSRL